MKCKIVGICSTTTINSIALIKMTACWIVSTVTGLTRSDSGIMLKKEIFLSNSVALFFMGPRAGGGELAAVVPQSVVHAVST